MKLMIASDVHGSAHFGRLLLDALDRERADRLLLLGDLLYHGPRNDLPQALENGAVDAIALGDPTASIAEEQYGLTALIDTATDPEYKDEYCCAAFPGLGR